MTESHGNPSMDVPRAYDSSALRETVAGRPTMSTAGMNDHGGEEHGADHRGADDHGAADGGDLQLMASRAWTGWKGSEAVTRYVQRPMPVLPGDLRH